MLFDKTENCAQDRIWYNFNIGTAKICLLGEIKIYLQIFGLLVMSNFECSVYISKDPCIVLHTNISTTYNSSCKIAIFTFLPSRVVGLYLRTDCCKLENLLKMVSWKVSCSPDSNTNSEITNPNFSKLFDQLEKVLQVLLVYCLIAFSSNTIEFVTIQGVCGF